MVGHVATITEGEKNVLKTGQQCVPSLNVLLVELITAATLIVSDMGVSDNVKNPAATDIMAMATMAGILEIRRCLDFKII